MQSAPGLRSHFSGVWKNNLLFASPSIRRPTMRNALVAANAIFDDLGDLRKPEYLYRIVQDALERGQEMKGHVAKMIRESGLADTEERIRQIILWNRKEKRDHLPEEIKEKIIHWEKEK